MTLFCHFLQYNFCLFGTSSLICPLLLLSPPPFPPKRHWEIKKNVKSESPHTLNSCFTVIAVAYWRIPPRPVPRRFAGSPPDPNPERLPVSLRPRVDFPLVPIPLPPFRRFRVSLLLLGIGIGFLALWNLWVLGEF